MPQEIHTTIETIEADAEKVVEEAREKAKQILVAAKAEAKGILSSELPMEEIQMEQDRIIGAAKEEASEQVEESKRMVSQLRASAKKKGDEAVRLIVNRIKGVI